jgi:tetratricopeptide (TPR) repeat protein
MKTVDKYLFQALDNYPYCLEETIESLDYALSYDNKSVMALCLYGRVYAEQLNDYDMAKQYYQEALAVDINAVTVYPFYLNALLLNEDYDEANTLIDFALTIKGINKAAIMFKKARLLERQNDIKGALKYLKEIKLQQSDNALASPIEELETRLIAKKEVLKGKKKGKSKKDKNDKEKKKKNRKK